MVACPPPVGECQQRDEHVSEVRNPSKGGKGETDIAA